MLNSMPCLSRAGYVSAHSSLHPGVTVGAENSKNLYVQGCAFLFNGLLLHCLTLPRWVQESHRHLIKLTGCCHA